ncbi:MAG: methionine adenosyltransferase [Oscillospiraceae bacterium]
MTTFFTSESVTRGHPDKVCDQIADAILDAILEQDSSAHVACEVTAITDKVHIMGEISTTAKVDYDEIARKTIRNIGYTKEGHGFDAQTCMIDIDIHEQSPDIAIGINRKEALDSGAGDQGMMFGYACNETDSLMPLPIQLAHRLAKRLEDVRRENILPYLLPDGKSQVTVEYDDGKPIRIATVIISSQHIKDVPIDKLRNDILSEVIFKALPADLIDDNTTYFVNPTGRFVVGGPAGDSGLTGRKIIVDTYGGYAHHGGGAFSGKDPTKVDRSGAYMARYIAKNIVAAGLAKQCEVQISYAIGLADPISVLINTFGTERIPNEKINKLIASKVDLRPAAIIDRFKLCRPLYSKLAAYGHFGDNAIDLPWEQTDLAEELKSEIA